MFVSKHSQVTGSRVTPLTLSQYKTLNPKPTQNSQLYPTDCRLLEVEACQEAGPVHIPHLKTLSNSSQTLNHQLLYRI
jgi:hypothetical protein